MNKSILAGFCIGIGSLVYLQTERPYNAFLFSIGLIMILFFQFDLYTGKIAYVHYGDAKKMLKMLIGNLIGCCLMFAFPNETAVSLMATKLEAPLFLVFIKSVICGVLVYTAVEAWKKSQWYLTILSIAVFILAGAEHCIADACYIISSRNFNIGTLIFFITCVFGNSIGAFGFDFLRKIKYN